MAILEPLKEDLLTKADTAEVQLKIVEKNKEALKKSRRNLESLLRKQKSLQSKIDLLHDHEYDPDCEFCCNNKFVQQAEQAKIDIVKAKKDIGEIQEFISELETTIQEMGESYLRQEIQDYVDFDMEFLTLRDESSTFPLSMRTKKVNIFDGASHSKVRRGHSILQ